MLSVDKMAIYNENFDLVLRVIEKLGLMLKGYDNQVTPEMVTSSIQVYYTGYKDISFKNEIFKGALKELLGEGKDE